MNEPESISNYLTHLYRAAVSRGRPDVADAIYALLTSSQNSLPGPPCPGPTVASSTPSEHRRD